ncbi:MAG: DUF1588 domain-containing protein [Phycisphaeraceae bacterium]|nr:DUF1588 domain-containing protein [Phycisphaeraceae bacterium]
MSKHLSLAIFLGFSATVFAARPEPDTAGFKTKILPLLDRYCGNCHDDAEKKGRLSLEGIDPDLLAGEDFETWRMIREQLQFGEMPPKKKKQPASAERRLILDWISAELRKGQMPGAITHEKMALPQFGNYVEHRALFDKRRDHVQPAPPRLWRLRPAIYFEQAGGLVSGARVSGLANGLNMTDGSDIKDYAAGYFIDEAGTHPLLGNAKKIAAAWTGPKSRDKAVKRLVVGSGPPSAKTVAEAIAIVFRKTLGRSPTPEEQKRFAKFHARAFKTGGAKPAGRALVAAIIMQPEVLYRSELGAGEPDRHGRVRLTPRETAYALSYALSNQPLETFLKAGGDGKLTSNDSVAALVAARLKDDSLLQDKNPRVLQFFQEYFNYPFATEVFKDKPEGGEHDAGLLVSDLETTIRDILRRDRDVLAELLTTRKFYVNARYKKVKREGVKLQIGHDKKLFYHTAYSLPYDWKWSRDRQPIEFPVDQRAGILTHPAWLTAWSGNFENHPVQRGKWVRTHLLGGTVPDVPIGVDARVPEKENTTFRERLRLATQATECWRCHRKMDPIGVAFERYDHYGRYQRLDAGQSVDASSVIDRTGVPELDGKKFQSPVQMVEFLARSEHVEQVFVRHVFRYFMGRNETLGDANTLQDAHRAYVSGGGSFRALVTSILSSDSFLLRQPLTAGRKSP